MNESALLGVPPFLLPWPCCLSALILLEYTQLKCQNRTPEDAHLEADALVFVPFVAAITRGTGVT
jgi:hypothetical protein